MQENEKTQKNKEKIPRPQLLEAVPFKRRREQQPRQEQAEQEAQP